MPLSNSSAADCAAARPSARRLWLYMQRVEANRHKAELLDRLATSAAYQPALRAQFSDLAVQRRELAEIIYGLSNESGWRLPAHLR